MKRILLAVGLVALVLAGCARVQPVETTQPVRQPQTHATTQALPKFRETTLVNDKNCLFRIEAIEEDGEMGYTLHAHLENRTDKTLMFSWSEVSVNGYMCDPFWAATVTAGMKSKEQIVFSDAELARSGIRDVAQIEFTLSVYDDDNWSAPRLVEEDFTVYPHGEAFFRETPRERHPGDIVLFENEDCAMTVIGFEPDNPWGYTLQVYLENRTDDTLMFSVGDAAVNGYLCDPFWAVTVAEEKRAYSAISWLREDFAAAGINKVEAISLPVRVYDADALSDAYLVNETFLLTPP